MKYIKIIGKSLFKSLDLLYVFLFVIVTVIIELYGKCLNAFGVSTLNISHKKLVKLRETFFSDELKSWFVVGHMHEQQKAISKKMTNNNLEIRQKELPGLNLNIEAQNNLLEYLDKIELSGTELMDSYNSLTKSDFEFIFKMVVLNNPKRVINIGSTTAVKAVSQALLRSNHSNQPSHIVIGFPAREEVKRSSSIQYFRKLINDVDLDIFESLNENDLVIIDLPQLIPPDQDKSFFLTEILPLIPKGVLICFNNITVPYEFTDDWLRWTISHWSEQNMLEILLTKNQSYKIEAALYYLAVSNQVKLQKVLPMLTSKELPKTFWIRTY
jgi:hypothetical protein